MIIVEAVLVEFVWTFVIAEIIPITLLILTLVIWALGTLRSGTDEYTIKALGFYLSFYGLPFFFLRVLLLLHFTPLLRLSGMFL